MKKITALLLALVMVLAMSASALADGTLTNGVDGTGTTPALTSLVFGKQIKVFNPESYAVRLPGITYTYTISGLADVSGAEVTDSDDTTATVLSGTDAMATAIFSNTNREATVSFSQSETVTASSSGVLTDAKDVTFTVNSTIGSAVPHAGIYRFKVTESTDVDKDKAGIIESTNYDAVKYLDVYIGNVNTADPGDPEVWALKVFGFVLFDAADDNTAKALDLNTTNAGTTKSDGWGEGEGTNGQNTDIDNYYTYNLTITKTTDGAMADKSHEFPIAGTLARATGLTATVTVDCSATNGTATVNGAQSFGATLSFGASLKNGGSYVIKGIPYYTGATPAYATLTALSETNDTNETYTVSVDKTNVTDTITAPGAVTGGGASATPTGFTVSGATFEADQYAPEIDITNTMETISPTGVVLRVAPYALMLGAGIILLVVLKSRKNKAAEEA